MVNIIDVICIKYVCEFELFLLEIVMWYMLLIFKCDNWLIIFIISW